MDNLYDKIIRIIATIFCLAWAIFEFVALVKVIINSRIFYFTLSFLSFYLLLFFLTILFLSLGVDCYFLKVSKILPYLVIVFSIIVGVTHLLNKNIQSILTIILLLSTIYLGVFAFKYYKLINKHKKNKLFNVTFYSMIISLGCFIFFLIYSFLGAVGMG